MGRGHYRDTSGDVGMGFHNNESESNLLRGAQPSPRGGMGMSSEENLTALPIGMERWQAPLVGNMYTGVPQTEETDYEAYRHGR